MSAGNCNIALGAKAMGSGTVTLIGYNMALGVKSGCKITEIIIFY